MLTKQACALFGQAIPSMNSLMIVLWFVSLAGVFGYPSDYLLTKGCTEPQSGTFLMGAPISGLGDNSPLLIISSQVTTLAVGGSTIVTLLRPDPGYFLVWVSGATILPASTAVFPPLYFSATCGSLAWTNAPSTTLLIRVTATAPGNIIVKGVTAAAYGQTILQSTVIRVPTASPTAVGSTGCNDLLLASGGPWHDAGGSSYTCAGYYSQPGKCLLEAGLYPFEGKTAKVACCVCKGGQTGRSPSSGCVDKTLTNGDPWHDPGGTAYNCLAYYSQPGKCASEGYLYTFNGITADAACCVCGGGTKTTTTNAPTSSPTIVTTHGGCVDKPLASGQPWHDIGGTAYTCSAYYSQAGKCAAEGTLYPFEGMTAGSACCVCGGGTSTSTGSGAPSHSPTTASGRCTDIPLSSGAAWHDQGGTFYSCAGYYSQPGKCAQEGSVFPFGGLTANQACCVCGGGAGTTVGSQGCWIYPGIPNTCPTGQVCIPSQQSTPGQPTPGMCTVTSARPTASPSFVPTPGPTIAPNCWIGPNFPFICSAGQRCSPNGPYNPAVGLTPGLCMPNVTTPTFAPTAAPTLIRNASVCRDIPLSSGAPWHDSGSTSYTCQYYAAPAKCMMEGGGYPFEGMTANVACCVCGGGRLEAPTCWVYPGLPQQCTAGQNCHVPGPLLIGQPTPGYCVGNTTSSPTSAPTASPTIVVGCWVIPNLDPNALCPSGSVCNPNQPLPNPLTSPVPGNCQAVSWTPTARPTTAAPTFPPTISPTKSPTVIPTPCRDKVLSSGQPWHDVGGTLYTCRAYYSTADVCLRDGFMYAYEGMTANDACCTCGGGVIGSGPTLSPTASPTLPPVCFDTTLASGAAWHDYGGSSYTCTTYYSQPGKCVSEGSLYAFQGLTANQACCICGGGSSRITRTQSPTMAPTAAPSLTPAGGQPCGAGLPNCTSPLVCVTFLSGAQRCDVVSVVPASANATRLPYNLVGTPCNFGGAIPAVRCKRGEFCATPTGLGPLPPYQTTFGSCRPLHMNKNTSVGCMDALLSTGAYWHDNGGVAYDCAYYAVGDHCAVEGSKFPFEGMTAQNACCVCGGGFNVNPYLYSGSTALCRLSDPDPVQCEAPLICVSAPNLANSLLGACLVGTGGADGDPCGVDLGPCKDGLICAVDRAAGMTNAQYGSSRGVCRNDTAGVAYEGQTCRFGGSLPSIWCASGLQCVPVTARTSFNPSWPNLVFGVCQSGPGQSIYSPCDPTGEWPLLCQAGLACVPNFPYPYNIWNTSGTCRNGDNGPFGVGSPCRSPDIPCDSGLVCVPLPTGVGLTTRGVIPVVPPTAFDGVFRAAGPGTNYNLGICQTAGRQVGETCQVRGDWVMLCEPGLWCVPNLPYDSAGLYIYDSLHGICQNATSGFTSTTQTQGQSCRVSSLVATVTCGSGLVCDITVVAQPDGNSTHNIPMGRCEPVKAAGDPCSVGDYGDPWCGGSSSGLLCVPVASANLTNPDSASLLRGICISVTSGGTSGVGGPCVEGNGVTTISCSSSLGCQPLVLDPSQLPADLDGLSLGVCASSGASAGASCVVGYSNTISCLAGLTCVPSSAFVTLNVSTVLTDELFFRFQGVCTNLNSVSPASNDEPCRITPPLLPCGGGLRCLPPTDDTPTGLFGFGQCITVGAEGTHCVVGGLSPVTCATGLVCAPSATSTASFDYNDVGVSGTCANVSSAKNSVVGVGTLCDPSLSGVGQGSGPSCFPNASCIPLSFFIDQSSHLYGLCTYVGGLGQMCTEDGTVSCSSGLTCTQYPGWVKENGQYYLPQLGKCRPNAEVQGLGKNGQFCRAIADGVGGVPIPCDFGLSCLPFPLWGGPHTTSPFGACGDPMLADVQPYKDIAEEGEVCSLSTALSNPGDCATGVPCLEAQTAPLYETLPTSPPSPSPANPYLPVLGHCHIDGAWEIGVFGKAPWPIPHPNGTAPGGLGRDCNGTAVAKVCLPGLVCTASTVSSSGVAYTCQLDPGPFPASTVYSTCTDMKLNNGSPWHDSGGSGFTCQGYYSVGGGVKCRTEGTNPSYAYPLSPGGVPVDAAQACCVCGGGV